MNTHAHIDIYGTFIQHTNKPEKPSDTLHCAQTGPSHDAAIKRGLCRMLQCIVYMLLAVYLDKVLPDRMGVRLPPWYPLLPSYWKPSKVCSFRPWQTVPACTQHVSVIESIVKHWPAACVSHALFRRLACNITTSLCHVCSLSTLMHIDRCCHSATNLLGLCSAFGAALLRSCYGTTTDSGTLITCAAEDKRAACSCSNAASCQQGKQPRCGCRCCSRECSFAV